MTCVTTPSGNEICRPFLPTKDLAHSCAFYEALGFKKIFQGDVAIFAVGATSFILQRYCEETWAKNTMMQVLVDDLDGWWERVMHDRAIESCLFESGRPMLLAPPLAPRQIATNVLIAWRSGHRLIVLDREGSLVLTIPPRDFENVEAISKAIFHKIEHSPSGTMDIKGPNGGSEIIGFVPVNGASKGLFTAVAIDRDSALTEASIINVRGIAFSLIALMLGVMGVWLAAYLMIDRPIRALIKSAGKREAGDTSKPFPRLRFSTEFGQLSAALSRMSGRINELLKQKDLLLRELQHRVMNSLNILSSLLDVQTRYIVDPAAKEHLAVARNRIIAMGTVYRSLYQAHTLEYVEFSEFLNTICNRSEAAYIGSDKVSIDVEAEPFRLSSAHAISLGMLSHTAPFESQSGNLKSSLC